MEITEIKQRLPMSQVLSYYGLKPDKNHRLHCPFHDDKAPSMQVYYKTQTCYCFSSNCPAHGRSIDVIDFILHMEKGTKHEAIQQAATMTGSGTTAPQGTILPTRPTIGREQILGNMFTYFKNAVANSRPAQDYIKSRGLDATKIGIGYNTGQFHHGARKDDTLISNCVAVGLLTPWGSNTRQGGQAYKPFAKYCIAFALRDRGNLITGLYFRSIADNDTAKHFYLKESSGLYPGYPKADTEKLIITESIIDAATLLQDEAIVKEYSIMAAYGVNRLNDEMKAAVSGLKGLKEIIFAFDDDEAGIKATGKYADGFKAMLPGIILSKIALPCKDVNETLQAHSEDIFIHLLQEREHIFPSSGGMVKDVEALGSPDDERERPEDMQAATPPPAPSGKGLDTTNPNKISYTTVTAIYYILGGLPKAMDNMKVMLSVENKQDFKSRNRVDLYEDKQVEKLCKEVSEKLRLRNDLLEQDIYKLTELLEQYRETIQEAQQPDKEETPQQPYFTAKERTELETFLKQENVIKRLNELLGKTGIVGEERNRIFLLLIALSHKMKEPLHALVQGSSGSGKTRIVRQVSDCMPEEQVTRFTRISDKALYNYPQHYFANRLLVIEDVDGLSEEAEMAFRELQSSGELRSSVSIKLENGSITGGEKIVSGPIASMSCTTKGEVYEDNMSRVFLIAVDESAEQTKRIIQYQNRKASGSLNAKEETATKVYIRNLMRIIVPKEVINPFAEKIQLPEEAHKIRRLNDLFQNFIKMVALINQYQRASTGSATGGKLIAQIEDIETAIEIMFESIVLKVDELDGPLRQFYENLKSFIAKKSKAYEFNRFEIREATGVGKTQQHYYIHKLVALEYIQQNGFANRGFRYKINYWDNYTAIRDRIKKHLYQQINAIKEEHHPNANRTPAIS